jgi:hypothetical protein
MSKVSPEFGRLISEFLAAKQITFRRASLQSGLSAAYWTDMAGGRVPSEDVIEKIAEAFQDINENELRSAAGYALKPGSIDPVEAVDFVLRGQDRLPEKAKREILDFVRETAEKYSGDKSSK